jgi:hypothetical protein
MVFKREKLGRLNKFGVLKVSLKIQGCLKVNISDNNVEIFYSKNSSDYQK